MLLGVVACQTVGVPPETENCATEAGSKIAYGLIRDYDMGGCKCADDSAEWNRAAFTGDESENRLLGSNGIISENWACYC